MSGWASNTRILMARSSSECSRSSESSWRAMRKPSSTSRIGEPFWKVGLLVSQWARRDILMSRDKNWRKTIFVSQLSRNYPHHGGNCFFRRMPQKPQPPLLLKYCNTAPICIAIRPQFVLHCFRCHWVPRKGKFFSTPPICIAVLLPFVSQYASHLYRNTPPICIAMLLGKSWWLWSPGCSPFLREKKPSLVGERQFARHCRRQFGRGQLRVKNCLETAGRQFLPRDIKMSRRALWAETKKSEAWSAARTRSEWDLGTRCELAYPKHLLRQNLHNFPLEGNFPSEG